MNNQISTDTTAAVGNQTNNKDRQYHHGNITYRHSGRKWHFTVQLPENKLHTVILQLRGGFNVASRIAPLVEKDVTKFGRLASNRPNIDRLIQAAA